MSKIQEIQCMILQIQNLGITIALQYIPAHCGISGNERADILAKKGSEIKQKSKINFSYESAKRIIKRNTNSKHCHSVKQKIQGKAGNKSIMILT